MIPLPNFVQVSGPLHTDRTCSESCPPPDWLVTVEGYPRLVVPADGNYPCDRKRWPTIAPCPSRCGRWLRGYRHPDVSDALYVQCRPCNREGWLRMDAFVSSPLGRAGEVDQ